jgi:bile acid:Na+ symporter, BASS family
VLAFGPYLAAERSGRESALLTVPSISDLAPDTLALTNVKCPPCGRFTGEDGADVTTTQTMIKAFGLLFVIGNSLGLGLRLQVGHMLAEHLRHWQLAVRVLLINFVILPGLIIGYAAIVDIPADIKIGYCIVALAAGAPFAPMLTGLAKGDVQLSTTLFVVLTVGTVVVVPLALSPLVSAVVSGVSRIGVWDMAWPLLVFILLPLLIGCLLRLRYPVTEHGERPLQLISLTCLLLYANVFIVSNWSSFESAWGTGTYAAAVAVPILGIALGSLISRTNVGARHASMITTAQRSIGGAIVVTLFNYPQPDANVAVTIINTIGITILVLLSLEWGRGSVTTPPRA